MSPYVSVVAEKLPFVLTLTTPRERLGSPTMGKSFESNKVSSRFQMHPSSFVALISSFDALT